VCSGSRIQFVWHWRRNAGGLNNVVVRSRAAFRLFGDSGALSAALVTRKLGIKPTTAIEARNRLGRPEAIWTLSTRPQVHDEVELSGQLARQLVSLLGVLEPSADVLRELTDMGYRANWECWVSSQATNHASASTDS
jgi:hypothetical protein